MANFDTFDGSKSCKLSSNSLLTIDIDTDSSSYGDVPALFTDKDLLVTSILNSTNQDNLDKLPLTFSRAISLMTGGQITSTADLESRYSPDSTIQGAQGYQGIQGYNGVQGAKGDTYKVKLTNDSEYISDSSYDEVWLWGIGRDGWRLDPSKPDDPNLYPYGIQGIQGIQGLQGIKGVQGTNVRYTDLETVSSAATISRNISVINNILSTSALRLVRINNDNGNLLGGGVQYAIAVQSINDITGSSLSYNTHDKGYEEHRIRFMQMVQSDNLYIE